MKHLERILNTTAFGITLGLASVLLSACSSQGVKWRLGSVPKSIATFYLDPDSLGKHNSLIVPFSIFILDCDKVFSTHFFNELPSRGP